MNFDSKKKTDENAQNKTSEPSRNSIIKKLTTAETGKSLAIHVILEVVIPYAYLMLCGLVFDYWLHLYNMTTFIFISYVILQLIGVALAVLCAINYKKSKKGAGRK